MVSGMIIVKSKPQLGRQVAGASLACHVSGRLIHLNGSPHRPVASAMASWLRDAPVSAEVCRAYPGLSLAEEYPENYFPLIRKQQHTN